MQMVRQRGKAGDDKLHKPADADADRTANTMQGDLLTEYAFYQGPLLFSHHALGGFEDKLPPAGLALIVLFPSMHVTISLASFRSTCWTRCMHNHSALLPP